MCKLTRNVKQQKFLHKLFFMEPLVWIPSLTNFKGDKREGCKTQLRIRKKKAPETTCACLKPLIPLTTFYCSFSLLFSPSQSCRRMPELRTAQTGFLFFLVVFLVETSISPCCSQLAMRMDSWRAQAKQFESGDAGRHLCDQGISSRTCLMDWRRWNRKAKTRKEK